MGLMQALFSSETHHPRPQGGQIGGELDEDFTFLGGSYPKLCRCMTGTEVTRRRIN